MGVTVAADGTFVPGPPRLSIGGAYYGSDVGFLGATYDVAPDGQRFLMIKEAASGTSDPFAGLTQIYVVLNWHQELLERVPVP